MNQTTKLKTFKDLWDIFQVETGGKTLLKLTYQTFLTKLQNTFNKTTEFIDPITKGVDFFWETLTELIPTISNLPLLYFDEFSISKFKQIVLEETQPIVSKLYSYLNLIDPKFLESKNLSDSNIAISKQQTSYSGFDVNNQDGTFNSINVENSGSATNQIAYMEFLNTTFVSLYDSVLMRFKSELCITIY